MPAPERDFLRQKMLRKYSRKSIARAACFKQDRRVPVKDATESLATAFNAPKANTCGVLNRDGIFYASLKMQGEEIPLEVALHGVRSESEALQAFKTLIQLRLADCVFPTPAAPAA